MPSYDNHLGLQTLLNIPLGSKSPLIQTHCHSSSNSIGKQGQKPGWRRMSRAPSGRTPEVSILSTAGKEQCEGPVVHRRWFKNENMALQLGSLQCRHVKFFFMSPYTCSVKCIMLYKCLCVGIFVELKKVGKMHTWTKLQTWSRYPSVWMMMTMMMMMKISLFMYQALGYAYLRTYG